MPKRRPFIGFRPDPEQLEQIDRLAAQQDVTRSAMIRRLIDEALASHRAPSTTHAGEQ